MLEELLLKPLNLILIVLFMIYFPILKNYENVEEIMRYKLINDTNIFINTVKEQKYIDKSILEDFNNLINTYGNYKLYILHKSLKYMPIYDDVYDKASFKNSFKVYYEDFNNIDIENVIYSNNFLDGNKIYNLNNGDFIIVTIKSLEKNTDYLKNIFYNFNKLYDISLMVMI